MTAAFDSKVAPCGSEDTKSGGYVGCTVRLEAACVTDFLLLRVPEREVILSIVV
jgi:hypothetical protein